MVHVREGVVMDTADFVLSEVWVIEAARSPDCQRSFPYKVMLPPESP